jgi:hypothetical protein
MELFDTQPELGRQTSPLFFNVSRSFKAAVDEKL